MTDPYKVLGVSPDATDDEVKKAYRALARKYHPDKYRDSDLADLASEKMKEVNAAYEEIQNIRKNGGATNNQNSSSQGSYNYGGGTSKNPLYNEVRMYLNQGNVAAAEAKLMSVHEGDRIAEWNFLYGCVLIKKGQYVDAQRYIDIACSMDPIITNTATQRKDCATAQMDTAQIPISHKTQDAPAVSSARVLCAWIAFAAAAWAVINNEKEK